MDRSPDNSTVRVFLAGIMQGSRRDDAICAQDWRGPVTEALTRHLAAVEVYCHFTRHPKSMTYGLDDARRTFREGVEEAARSDVLVAYCPSASMGTAIELYEAHRNGAVVLAISPMSSNWVLLTYADRVFTDVEAFERFLAGGGIEAMLAAKADGAEALAD
jgi:hypothetical protein